MTGISGPLNIPLEEYLFFILIPIAAWQPLDVVTKVLPIVRNWLSRPSKLVTK
jgi:hypothetical protein